jgi:hypothetical protein
LTTLQKSLNLNKNSAISQSDLKLLVRSIYHFESQGGQSFKKLFFLFFTKRPNKNKNPQRYCPTSKKIYQEYQKGRSRVSARRDDSRQKINTQSNNADYNKKDYFQS